MPLRRLAVLLALLSGCLDPQRGAVTTLDVGMDAPEVDTAAEDTSRDVPANDVRDVPAPDPDALVLDPSTLSFFYLPIGSLRHAVAGWDPARKICATIVWWGAAGHCQSERELPYVLLRRDDDGGCEDWDYGGDTEVTASEGCVDFASEGPGHLDLADVVLEVASPLFTGKLVVDSRSMMAPTPITLGLRLSSDIPEDAWVQAGDAYGLPGWVTVSKDGAPLVLWDRCDLPLCGQPTGVCGAALPVVARLANGSFTGEMVVHWDGRIRAPSPHDCWSTAPAPAGAYTARFCFGWKIASDDGYHGEVLDPVCQDVPFTLPTEKVFWNADFGG